MPQRKRPLRGSKGFWPKKKAKRIYSRVKVWPKTDSTIPLGFAGYKVGMTHVLVTDTNTNSQTKGQLRSKSVTVLECPPISVLGIRGYYDSTCVDVFSDKFDKNLSRKMKVPKVPKMDLEKLHGKKFECVHLLCYTQPEFKKTPEIFEIAIGGAPEKQLEFAKNLIGKEFKISEVFKEGDFVDVIGVTKGKGYQGVVKRFGVRIQYRKNEQAHRKIGCHGQNEPGKIRPHIPQAGQLGFQTRTEFNKRILKIATGTDINPKGGFVNYGLVNNDYILVEGSVPGSIKRLVRMRGAIRPFLTKYPIDIKYISTVSMQGD